MCGNFNDKEEDEFTPRNGGSALAEAHRFADEWRTNERCEDAQPEPARKCDNNEKEIFAKQVS